MNKYKIKKISNRDTGNGIQQLYYYEKYLTVNMHDFFNSSNAINSDLESKSCTSLSILDIWEHLTVTIERINSKCNSLY